MQWKYNKLQTVCMGNLINHALIKQDTKELCLFSNTFTLSAVCMYFVTFNNLYIQQFIEYLHRIKCSLSIRYCLGLEFEACESKLSEVALLLAGFNHINKIKGWFSKLNEYRWFNLSKKFRKWWCIEANQFNLWFQL